MALVTTNVGGIEAGAGTVTGLTTASGQRIWPPPATIAGYESVSVLPQTMQTCRDRQGMYLALNIVGTQSFRISYEFTTDGGTTWYEGAQWASSAVTADGGAAGYTNNVNFNYPVGYQFRILLYNGSGSTGNFAYEYRYYSDAG